MMGPPVDRLDRLRGWVRSLDSAFRIPGTQIRFGWDPILGLLPGVGDLAPPLLSGYRSRGPSRWVSPGSFSCVCC